MPSNGVREVLSDAAKDGISSLLEEVALKGLTDASRIATDLPQFLADDDFIAPGALPTRLIGRQACRAWARGGGPSNNPGFDGLWGGLCEPYLASIGELPADGSVAPPVEGGQCAIPYDYTWEARDFVSGSNPTEYFWRSASFAGGRLGPISVRNDASGETCGVPGESFGNWIAVSPSGNIQLSGGCYDVQPSYRNFKAIPRVPADDTCGSPPAEYDPSPVPPGLPPLAPTIPVRLPGIGPIDVGISFNPDGTLNVNLPDVGVEVNLPNPFDGGDDGGEPPVGGPPPGDVGEPGQPSGTGAGGEAAGEAPPGKVLTGLRVVMLSFPNSRNKYTEEVYRGAYYVYMGVPSLLDLDFGGAMVRPDQFFFAEKDNLTSWRVSANDGYNLSVTPYYRSAD